MFSFCHVVPPSRFPVPLGRSGKVVLSADAPLSEWNLNSVQAPERRRSSAKTAAEGAREAALVTETAIHCDRCDGFSPRLQHLGSPLAAIAANVLDWGRSNQLSEAASEMDRMNAEFRSDKPHGQTGQREAFSDERTSPFNQVLPDYSIEVGSAELPKQIEGKPCH
jgi:hypothetical protein